MNTRDEDGAKRQLITGFSELYTFDVQHADQYVVRARGVLVEADASPILKAAIGHMEELRLAYPEAINREAHGRVVEFCEAHQYLGGNPNQPNDPSRNFYFPRIYLRWKMVNAISEKVCRDTERKGYFDFDDHKALMSANFQLGALCREFQLAEDNQRAAMNNKRTTSRLNKAAAAENIVRAERAAIWRDPVRAEAARRWSKDPSPSAKAMAVRLRSWMVRQGIGFTDQDAPRADTIRKAISDLRPKPK